VIVVTGLMRSGTTPLARMLHQGGVPMGESMMLPAPGSPQHVEWEDLQIQTYLRDRLMNDEGVQQFQLRYYIRQRQHTHRKLLKQYDTVLEDWGFKTPFAAPFMAAIEEAAHSEGDSVFWVVAEREIGETLKSIEKQMKRVKQPIRRKAHEIVEKIQGELQRGLEKWDGPRYCIEETWVNPARVWARLTDELALDGLSDGSAERAIRGIGRDERWA
jgi:hypothetical protein